ncbi:ankyrin repeat domain-containing protein [Candidatus Babeliales bacterium]|nr:ankyrin repeat domain-containing protein [Candidatus Babeliales bacterium]
MKLQTIIIVTLLFNTSFSTPLLFGAEYQNITLPKTEYSDKASEELLIAAEKGNIGEANALLAKGANPNLQNKDGNTPLHLATVKGYNKVLSTLFENGANPNMQNKYGNVPLHFAVINEQTFSVNLFIKYGANLSIQNYSGVTPLEKAKQRLLKDIVRILEEAMIINLKPAKNKGKATS